MKWTGLKRDAPLGSSPGVPNLASRVLPGELFILGLREGGRERESVKRAPCIYDEDS